MTNIDLTEADLDLLRRLGDGERSPDALASTVDADAATVEDRLAALADNALVREGEEGYELTENGRRVVRAPGDGRADERVDTPPAVERALDSFDLRADAEVAVRNAFTFLRERERASPEELTEGVFSEAAAGYDDPDDWWDELVRDRLLALPGVTSPARGDYLRFDGADVEPPE